jgi:WNK lysine deficient protein kinase
MMMMIVIVIIIAYYYCSYYRYRYRYCYHRPSQVDLDNLPEDEKSRILQETRILADINHPKIINFYEVWTNTEKNEICFTTEIVTSGTLKQYSNKKKAIKLKVIKDWCRQILQALQYLHEQDPPIIHRDIKCDNIFINGSSGEIRLGDFGLAAHSELAHSKHNSVLGTPQFMAPELYDENYTEKVDIYAFGMSVLEMITKEYPYEECRNPAQVCMYICM